MASIKRAFYNNGNVFEEIPFAGGTKDRPALESKKEISYNIIIARPRSFANLPPPTESDRILPLYKRIGKCLYRKGGAIYARVRVNGKQTWRSTGTNIPADARRWLEKWRREEWALKYGIETIILHRSRVTGGELMDNYVNDGIRTRKGRPKSPATVKTELACLKPLRAYFGNRPAAAVSLANCDKYRDWRTGGGFEQKHVGTPSVDLELTILANI